MIRSGASRHAARLITLAALSIAVVPVVGPTAAGAAPAAACTIAVNDDAYSTAQDTPLTVDPIGVVANDQICDTDGLVISTSSPSHGQLTDFDDAEGGFTYTPDASFTGTDSFTYVLEDVGESPEATVTITVTGATTSSSSSTSTTSTTRTTSTTAPTTTSTTVAPVAAAATPVTAAPTFTG